MSEPRNSSKSDAAPPNPGAVMDVQEANAKYLLPAEQQVPKGYKQTEVGVIPEDWELASIEDVAQITTGSKNTQDKIEDGEYPFFVRSQTVEHINSYSYDGEAVLTAGDGVGTGKVFHYIRGKFDAHQRVYRISEFSSRLNGYFFYLYFSNHFYNRIMQMTAKSSVDSVRREMIAKMLIPLPPTKAEQEAIAEALSDADALIEALEQLVAKKRQLKQGAMQELLTGKRRLPGFETKLGVKITEIGTIPIDWEYLQIADFIDLLTGFPFPSSKYSMSGIRLLRGSNVKRGITDWSDDGTAYWPSATSELKKYLLKSGDIVIAMDGSLVGRSFAMLSDCDLPALLLQRVARIRPAVIDQKYLKEWICSPRFTDHCDAVKTVTAIPHISPADIRSFQITIPPTKAEQIAIAQILTDMDAEITVLDTKLTKARAVKQGMMQQLLTGKIRLVVNPKPIIDN
ncbi:restriction endonuclease subunit S [Methylicorpusculum sp.]|uniref:restriction endonuclease subunit S n=1 Tax=Methylicorpusculum sp. TaxID=2713644 RepID=UPI002719DCB9|nr:restriction endonuclease subunit S [Methylicorpusculum sp.]MDO8843437.1 restriction endonuclease subunit S [Methylicorpusculum sp.]